LLLTFFRCCYWGVFLLGEGCGFGCFGLEFGFGIGVGAMVVR
jgi:hypothetical protein